MDNSISVDFELDPEANISYCTKQESRLNLDSSKYFPPHVVVFTNMVPNPDALSSDRLDTFMITGKEFKFSLVKVKINIHVLAFVKNLVRWYYELEILEPEQQVDFIKKLEKKLENNYEPLLMHLAKNEQGNSIYEMENPTSSIRQTISSKTPQAVLNNIY